MNDILIHNPNFCKSQAWASRFITTLNGLCQKDYHKDFFTEDFDCIDLDMYETSLSGDNDKSVDGVVGLNYGQSSQALLVELKLGMTNPAQFDATKAEEKINHSCDILNGKSILVCDKVFFLYPSNITPQIKNRITRYAIGNKKLQRIEATDISGFENTVKPNNATSFIPAHPESEIQESIMHNFYKGDDDFVSICEYWKRLAETERQHYHLDEYNHIVKIVLTKLNKLQEEPNLSENQVFYIQYYQSLYKSL